MRPPPHFNWFFFSSKPLKLWLAILRFNIFCFVLFFWYWVIHCWLHTISEPGYKTLFNTIRLLSTLRHLYDLGFESITILFLGCIHPRLKARRRHRAWEAWFDIVFYWVFLHVVNQALSSWLIDGVEESCVLVGGPHWCLWTLVGQRGTFGNNSFSILRFMELSCRVSEK